MSESGLRILVWNCNGLTNDKLTEKEFVDLIKNSDIAILSESWTNNLSEIDIDGYLCYNLYRKFRHRKAKRKSGGIAVYINEKLSDGISIVKNNFDTIIWLCNIVVCCWYKEINNCRKLLINRLSQQP